MDADADADAGVDADAGADAVNRLNKLNWKIVSPGVKIPISSINLFFYCASGRGQTFNRFILVYHTEYTIPHIPT